MRGTYGLWQALGIGVALAVLGVLADRPVLLAGSVLIGAWVVAVQAGFVTGVHALLAGLSVRHRVEPHRVLTGEESALTLQASSATPSPLSVTFRSMTPAGLEDVDVGPLTLDRGDTEVETRGRVSSPVAGSHDIDRPRGDAVDPVGLWETTFSGGDGAHLAVEPRVPRNIHVGQGGEAVSSAWGDHKGEGTGAGLEPAEIRQYVPGDPARSIDWRATARLGEPHVREFEQETDRRLFVVVDARATMAEGQDGQTKLDYLREIALGYVDSAHSAGDPLGVATIGDDGLLGRLDIDQTEDHYAHATKLLRELSPTEGGPVQSTGPGPNTATAQESARRLTTDDSRFGETLRPFLGASRSYADRVESDPLARGVRSVTERTSGSVWSVILTDDSRPGELRDAVTVARQRHRRVLVFLTPSILFEPGGLGNLEQAYDRYREFESLRAELDGLSKVTAYEVGPGDRFAAVLSRAGSRSDRRGEV